jgi:hypothetical protein
MPSMSVKLLIFDSIFIWFEINKSFLDVHTKYQRTSFSIRHFEQQVTRLLNLKCYNIFRTKLWEKVHPFFEVNVLTILLFENNIGNKTPEYKPQTERFE